MTSSSNRILYVVSLKHATNDGSVYVLSSLFPIVLALFNVSVFQVGLIVALGYLVNILFQPVVSHYSEGRDPARLLSIGMSVIAFSIISFIFATGFLSLLASVILLRLGSSFFHPLGYPRSRNRTAAQGYRHPWDSRARSATPGFYSSS